MYAPADLSGVAALGVPRVHLGRSEEERLHPVRMPPLRFSPHLHTPFRLHVEEGASLETWLVEAQELAQQRGAEAISAVLGEQRDVQNADLLRPAGDAVPRPLEGRTILLLDDGTAAPIGAAAGERRVRPP